MEERFLTQWVRSWGAVPASMFRRGLMDIEPIGTSTLPKRAIQRGVMKPFSTCIAAVLRRGLEDPIRTTAAYAEWCTCSPPQNLTHSPSLCWKAAESVGLQRFPN